MRAVAVIVLLLFQLTVLGQGLSINELMSKNNQSLTDEDADYSDWIELYNSSAELIDVSGWYLSDDEFDTQKWQINAGQIEPEGFLLVFASSKDRQGPGELHTNFNISAAGEIILLSSPDGLVVDQTNPIVLQNDFSYGSATDGDVSERIVFEAPSPGASNATGVPQSYVPDELFFSITGGFYSESVSVLITSSQNADVRYTLDGSEPMLESPLLSAAIGIADREGEDDVIAKIKTGAQWQEPREKGEKATVLKAASFDESQRISPIYTETYFISNRLDKKYQNLPVISLSVDADSLFSSAAGIYVIGDGNGAGDENFRQSGRAWEREVHMEFFDEQHHKAFQQNVGARIHGNSSRGHSQKSIRLYARGEYGASTLDYPFFKGKDLDEFKRIILRTSSSDWGETMFRDDLCARLVSDMEVDYMETQTCIVFINGEYWGVHNIRERVDEHYLAANHQVDDDELDLLAMNSIVENGDAQAYEQLITYINSNDIASTENYAFVSEQIDIISFIDYHIAQLYLANFDWPLANIRYWKGHGDDYKWRYIFYDCDRCMAFPGYDHLVNVVYEDSEFNTAPGWTTTIFNGLVQNEEFKEEFVQRFFFHLSTTFEAQHVLDEMSAYEDVYQPLIVDHFNRWSYPSSINTWNESVQEMRAFVLKRPAVMIQQIMDYIGEQYALYPNPVAQSASHVNLDMEYTEGLIPSIKIFSTSGRLMTSFDLGEQTAGNHPQIPIDRLEPGIYLVRILYGSLAFTEKLVVH